MLWKNHFQIHETHTIQCCGYDDDDEDCFAVSITIHAVRIHNLWPSGLCDRLFRYAHATRIHSRCSQLNIRPDITIEQERKKEVRDTCSNSRWNEDAIERKCFITVSKYDIIFYSNKWEIQWCINRARVCDNKQHTKHSIFFLSSERKEVVLLCAEDAN